MPEPPADTESPRDAPGAGASGPRSEVVSPEALAGRVYERLRELAGGRMRREHPGRLLQPTALVHEAYLRLLKEEKEGWTPRQFLAAAAEAMRRILVEQARSEGRLKRGGGRRRERLSGVAVPGAGPSLDVLALDEAMEGLREADPRGHEVVMLRFFCGMEMGQIAEVLGVATRTVDREWRCARLWLYERLGAPDGEDGA